MSEENKKNAPAKLSLETREMRIYANIYRVLSIVAAFAGFLISAVIYNAASGGELWIILERPAFVFNILAPFIPAFILGLISVGKTKKFYKMAKKDGIDIKALRKRTDLYSHKEAGKK